MTEKEKQSNHIEEYFSKNETQLGNELFRIDKKNLPSKTELTNDETKLITVLKMNDIFLESKGLIPIYEQYYNNFMHLRISKDRKGRTEYVDIHRKDNSDSTLNKLNNFKNALNPNSGKV
jgi:hypothetical protein